MTVVKRRIQKMRVLPIGSVVKINQNEKEIMITGYLQKEEKRDKVYEYCGCPYPFGILSSKNLFLFNGSEITGVSFVGFINAEMQVLLGEVTAQKEKLELE